ncbi:MAG TPA: alkaline phosphatase [Thermoanaerobaculia bacterium]|nr:alkaline phosphatase [Thermoanaerobaculia bacterium]
MHLSLRRNLLFSLASVALAATLAGLSPRASADLTLRVTPPNKVQLLQNQRFDIRVEATADAGATVTSLKVTVDGIDVTSRGVSSGFAQYSNWDFRYAEFGISGNRVIAATATSSNGQTLSASSTVTVRAWDQSQIQRPSGVATNNLVGIGTFPDVEAAAGRSSFARAAREVGIRDVFADADEMHLGKVSPLFHVYPNTAEARAAGLVDVPVKKAKNVILFIGDGMGAAHRTAARVMSKGYTAGKANGTLAMDRLPYNGLHMTSSLNSLITDSAPGAHNYSTGNKTNNGMEGVFPDNTGPNDDNPRIENLSEFSWRMFGKVTGIVSNAFLTDATPAAFIAHTADRGDGTLVANQYFDQRNTNGLKVLMGGGAYHFIPKSTTGSRRTDERNVVNDFKNDGWTYVDTATALNGFAPGPNGRLFGLFNLDNMNVAFDILKQGDPSVTATFPDQPLLKELTQKAIDTLKQYPNGFFLMVESAHIDKQAHRMDAERSIYEVIQLDHAVQVAMDFAAANGETLVIVSADHECAGMALPAVGRPDKKGTQDYAKSYNYAKVGAGANDSAISNFTDYVVGTNGYPVSPEPSRRLIVNFGAAPEHYEDWTYSKLPRNSSATEGGGFDPGIVSGGKAVANPNDPKKNTAGAFIVSGVLETGASGGDAQTQAVHTMSDIPISAMGPGASQFARVQDNTEAFFEIMNAMLGTFPIPASF